LHNKCSVPECRYPNPPQAAEGKYNCRAGSTVGFYCEGTYIVSRAAANEVMRLHKESLRQEAEAERTKLRDHQRDEQARQVAARFEMETLGAKARGPRLERRAAQRKRHGANEVTPDSPLYYPRPAAMPQSRATQTLPDPRNRPRRAPPGALPANQCSTFHFPPLPPPPMSHRRAYLTHPASRI
jgi:hypothetical protein